MSRVAGCRPHRRSLRRREVREAIDQQNGAVGNRQDQNLSEQAQKLYANDRLITASLDRSCPESGGKEKWRILPVGEVHDQRARVSRKKRGVLLFSLVASGQIKLRKIDGWQKIGAVLSQHTAVAA
jgi:hypothetical protein